MKSVNNNIITEATRRAIFRSIRRGKFEWWGDSDEADLLSEVFDLESMESFDSRQFNAFGDIRVHRGEFRDWDDDWIFDDARLDLLHCPDGTLVKLFVTMAHPTIQPDGKKVKWLVDLVNQHLAPDGWRLDKVSTISGRPVYEGRRQPPGSAPGSERYITPEDLDIDLESALYTVSRVFALRGQSTEVAILADAYAELKQYFCGDPEYGYYKYVLYLRVPPSVYAATIDDHNELQKGLRCELTAHFVVDDFQLHSVVIQCRREKAPPCWQNGARAFVDGQGVTNQGRVRSTSIAAREVDGLLFRSQPEINLYQALKQRGVAFAPLPVFLRGGDAYQRIEPDFVVIKDGVFAVVEVDGDCFHSETPASAQSRLRMLEAAGAIVIRVNANSCNTQESAEASANRVLEDMTTHKNNRR